MSKIKVAEVLGWGEHWKPEGKNWTIYKLKVAGDVDGEFAEDLTLTCFNNMDVLKGVKVGDVIEAERKDNKGRISYEIAAPKKGFGGGAAGGRPFTPRDIIGEERAKCPSMALSYAKDMCVDHDEAGTEEVIAMAEAFYDWMIGKLNALAKSSPSTTAQAPTKSTMNLAMAEGLMVTITETLKRKALYDRVKAAAFNSGKLIEWWNGCGGAPVQFAQKVDAELKKVEPQDPDPDIPPSNEDDLPF